MPSYDFNTTAALAGDTRRLWDELIRNGFQEDEATTLTAHIAAAVVVGDAIDGLAASVPYLDNVAEALERIALMLP